jgi:hyaluronan synthase
MILFTSLTLWAIKHIIDAIATGSARNYVNYYWFYLFSFIVMAVTIILANREKPRGDETKNHYHNVAVIVPAYNEDEDALHDCLDSLITQSRPPETICVVDDGSTTGEYTDVKSWFLYETERRGIKGHWRRKQNGGKRHAQAVALELTHEATIYVTVDSDSVLDHEALNELLKPFGDDQIQSVAGVVLARNNRTNLLARFTDLLFVTGQMIDRSMMSSLGSVLVNSGGLAGYRAEILRDNLDAYLNESFFGRHIEFSDDSMLTLYSLLRGKTVQQPSAFVFTLMPDKLNHHIRQQIRWAKGSFIRSWWRLKYLPIMSPGFIRQLVGWGQFAMSTTLVIILFILHPAIKHELYPQMLLIPILVGYGQALRYFSVQRSDESLKSQILTYLLAPLATLWAYFVLRPIRLYAMATCFNTKWGTRKKVEVGVVRKPAPSIGLHWSTRLRMDLRSLVGSMRNGALNIHSFSISLPSLSQLAISESKHIRFHKKLYSTASSIAEAETAWIYYYERLNARAKQKAWSEYYLGTRFSQGLEDLTNILQYNRSSSRHITFLYKLLNTDIDLEAKLATWRDYYQALSDQEKSTVWNDYYNINTEVATI